MYRHVNNLLLNTINTRHTHHTTIIKKNSTTFHIIKTFVVFIVVKINVNILNISKSLLKFKIRENSELTTTRDAKRIFKKIETIEIIDNRRNNDRRNND